MSLLKHQIILHPDMGDPFALDKPVTPYERRVGFSWYLCPATVANAPAWVLVNVECGYCAMTEGSSAEAIEQAVLDAIEYNLLDEREEDNVSVSFHPDDISWHSAEKMPVHVAQRYQKARNRMRKCKDHFAAEDEIERLNATPLSVGGRRFAPVDALEGLLLELADNFSHYVKVTPWWKVWWNAKFDRHPWLAQGYRRR